MGTGRTSTLLWLRRHPRAFLSLARRQGDFVPFTIGNRRIVLLSHPALIERVLEAPYGSFEKDWGPRRGASIFGNGLLTSEGPEHRAQRLPFSALFARSAIEARRPAVAAIIDEWSSRQRDGAAIDVFKEMTLVGTEVALRVLFGRRMDPAKVNEAVSAVAAGFRRVMFPYADRLRRRRDRAKGLREVIAELRTTATRVDDGLLAPLLVDVASGYGDVDDQLATFLVTGQETVRIATSWAWSLLGRNPAAREKLQLESRIVQAGERTPYAEAVFLEALRLEPPQWMIGRRAIEPFAVDGHSIPAGALVLMSPYVVQRDPRFFDRPDEFLPERWLRPDGRPSQRYAYFPFGGGARRCIGEALAMTVGTMVLSMIAGEWEFDLGRTRVKYDARLTLQPRSMPARLRRLSVRTNGR
jgi:cytochrome P450